MPDKLTDEEIVKALERLIELTSKDMLISNKGVTYGNVLDLINRLQNDLAISQKETKRYATGYKTAKTEAYKEFAERLKRTFPKDDFLRSTKQISKQIDNLLKEMVGDNDAN